MRRVVKGSLLAGTFLLTSFLFSAQANADDQTINPLSYGKKHSYCSNCTPIVRQYNIVIDDLHSTQYRLTSATNSFKANSAALTREQAKIKALTDAANKAADRATKAATTAMAADEAASQAQPSTPLPAPAPAAAPATTTATKTTTTTTTTTTTPAATPAAPAAPPVYSSLVPSPAASVPAAPPAPLSPQAAAAHAAQVKADAAAAETADAAAKSSDVLTKANQKIAEYQKNIDTDAKIVQESTKHLGELMQERTNLAEEVSNCESQSCGFDGYRQMYYQNLGCPVKDKELFTGPEMPMPVSYPHKHTNCSYCGYQTIRYNDLVDALFETQKNIRSYTIDRDIDLQMSKKAQARIDALQSKRFNPVYKPKYDQAVMDYNHSARLYKMDTQKINTENDIAFDIRGQMDKAAEARLDCENDNCRPLLTTSAAEKQREKSFIPIPMEYQVGLLADASDMYRNSQATGPFGNFTQSTTRGQYGLGGQLNVLFGAPEKNRFMVFGNMFWMMGPSETLLSAQVNPASVSNSTLHVTYDWLAHIGAGLQTKPYYKGRLRWEFGPAMAIVHQKLATSVVDGVTSTHNRIDRKDIRPSIMGGMTYDLCQSCFYQSPVAFTAQVFADNYGNESVSGVTPSGNNYIFTAGQNWEIHGQVGLLAKF